MPKPRISLGALGGTIASARDPAGSGGVVPNLTAQALANAVPGLGDVADINAKSLRQLAGGSLTFAHLLEFLVWAENEAEQGAAGIVMTQGTDTLEETSFFLDLFWERSEPLVLTGAMRTADQLSADGPANLFGAVTVAAAAASRGRGVHVVMNDVVHEARWVRKAHSLAVNAFESPNGGAAGALVEGQVHYFCPPPRRQSVPRPRNLSVRVPLVEICLSDDTLLLDAALRSGCQGLVLSAFGAGHAPLSWAEPISAALTSIPVVIATRTGAGSTASRTYSFVGSEMDLARRGAILAGWLDARKARLLLWALLASGGDRQTCQNSFRKWNRAAESGDIFKK